MIEQSRDESCVVAIGDSRSAIEKRTGGIEVKKSRIKRIGHGVARGLSAPLLAIALVHPATAQESPAAGTAKPGSPDTSTLPPVDVRANASSQVPVIDNINDPEQVTGLSKTGTALKDLPASVQVIPRALLTEQGATMLRQGVANASGVNVGGQDTKGYYDHFLIRGLNAQIYNDGFSDGDLLGGVSHSLNGVERIEVLEGPGSALFGSGPPGGTINLVHYEPSSEFHFGGNIQSGSFGTIGGSGYVTGPTGIAGLNYRVDATVSRSDGFRDLASRDEEIRPAFEWKLDNHKINFSLDARDIHETPDSYGLIYFHGTPITGVPIDAKYSTPFAYARGNYVRPTLTDEWKISDILTINNRFSYLHHSLDVLGNGDSTSTKVSDGEVVGRQLRQQDDSDNSIDYQLEPVWRFGTGSVKHTLLTGFEYQHQTIDTERTTADLPNIPDAFAPVPPETSLAGLTFLCDAKHSCDNDHLVANYYSLYATDQIDVTDKLKVRAGVRKDWWDTSLTPNITVPGRFDTQGQPLVAGVTDSRNDAPVSWNIGVLYKVLPWMSPYVGVSKSHLTNFNSESTQNGIGAPESALQYEVGVKFSFLDDRYVLNTALFDVSRDNVATLTTINGVESVVFDGQKTKGAEASLDASITPQWHLTANFTAQDPKITDNPQALASVGNRPQGAPAFIGNLWTTYDFSIDGVPGFHVGAGVNYAAKSYSDATNVNSIPSYVIANAAFGYETSRWGVDLNVHNLTDRRYFIAANAAGAYVGESLSAFVSLHAHF
uniref:TonB-dependent receptor n=1 Tax=Burkholderia sp. M701 TaxID=326454 RepID=V5YP26_9BURK|nr:TonB-dependent siderophore receptor [Burkholderia sp. M701]BAO19152.1 putative TonB-dependent receptor [Burkholderia sp. M701]